MTTHGAMSDSVYDWPAAYEIAFGFRDVEAECDFLVEVATRLRGVPPMAAVELAAGPGLHARALARRGLRTWAVDRSPGAIAYLGTVAPEVIGVEADLRDYRLPMPVDLAFCPLNGFAYLLTDEDWQAALAATARALTRRGALVIELVLDDYRRQEPQHWRAERGGVVVEVSAGPTKCTGDWYEWELTLRVRGPEGEQVQRTTERQRVMTAQSTEQTLRDAGYTQIALYADYDLRRRWRGHGTLVAIGRRP